MSKPQLKVKYLPIDSGDELIAYIHQDSKWIQALGLRARALIEIHNQARTIIATLHLIEADSWLGKDEIGLSTEAFNLLDCPINHRVNIAPSEPNHSMHYVREKIAGEPFTQSSLNEICQDIAQHRYSPSEVSAFLVACAQTRLNRQEILYLTQAMINQGKKLDWNSHFIVDKHCIGGIPGNRTTLIVTPIIAAFGLTMPKTSSRAITSPAGTADTMEVFANVNLSMSEMQAVVHEHQACIAWGGTAQLSPIDDLLIKVERPLMLDSQGQMIASILSKKIAAGATHLLLDIPVGPYAKVRSMSEAQRLKQEFEFVSDHLGMHTQVILTDGTQPIGRGIGPILESKDVIAVLENQMDAPQDLREKSLKMAGHILEFSPNVRGGQGYEIAKQILESGQALNKFRAITDSQGLSPIHKNMGKYTLNIQATETGTIQAINNRHIARLAHLTGAPTDAGAGIFIHKKVGDTVQQGEILYTLYANVESNLEFARNFLKQYQTGYTFE